MTATAVLVILVGIFIIINAPNFVGVIQGNKKLSFLGTAPSSTTSTTTK